MRRALNKLDLKNGLILTLFAIALVLYSKLLDKNLRNSNFSLEQIAYDSNGHLSKTPLNPPPAVYETETTHFDGLLEYTRTTPSASADLLVLLLTHDATSWGHNIDKPLRTFHDFLELLITTHLNLTTTSLALWTNTEDQYLLFRAATARLPLARVSIFLDSSPDASPRGNRHDPDHQIQTSRRAHVARLRNKLLLHAVSSTEQHLLWLDADVDYLSPGIVQRMVWHSATNANAGIITARCQEGPTYNYDKNAWAGVRDQGPGTRSSDPEIAAAEEASGGQTHVDRLIHGTGDEELVELDAVGGTILYMRASLVWEGLRFPSSYVVGTRWGREGFDGLETEGVCQVALGLKGGKCWVLGGHNFVSHTNF